MFKQDSRRFSDSKFRLLSADTSSGWKMIALDKLKHLLLIFMIILYIKFSFMLTDYMYNENDPSLPEFIARYGVLWTFSMYLLNVNYYITIPYSVLNIVGLVMFNPFTRMKKNIISEDSPFVCFRVVTRGLYPNLVKSVTSKNMELCIKAGLKNFIFEIVTDKRLNVEKSTHLREIVVPSDYKTAKGSLFKARALNYCLMPTVNTLSPEDWIVHLDEETQITEEVVHGIVDFISKPNSKIGQGVIVYGGLEVENWVTTLLDGIRTSKDYGVLRLSFQFFRRPLHGLKGSFVVVKSSVEEEITFDFGPRECIAEDLRFALTAWDLGYKFDFVEGIMLEKSPFTMSDYAKQRKRWLVGTFQILWSKSLPLYVKLCLFPSHLSTLFLWANVFITVLSLISPQPPFLKCLVLIKFLLLANILCMILFGNYMSMRTRRTPTVVKMAICFVAQILLPVLGVTESYSSFIGFLHRNHIVFDLVEKETPQMAPKHLI